VISDVGSITFVHFREIFQKKLSAAHRRAAGTLSLRLAGGAAADAESIRRRATRRIAEV
jgi:hypothetical protein